MAAIERCHETPGLEGVEFVLDPFKREFRPMASTLMGASPFR
jgi:hypothetical protein